MPPPIESHLSRQTVAARLPLFVFEALGSLACGFYGNYIFFHFRDQYGFGELGNLGIAALMGLVIGVASWQGGRFAQTRGYYTAMYVGLIGLIAALVVGAFLPQLPVQLCVLVLWAASQFMICPALEALVTEGEGGSGRAQLVGIFSVVWASCSALSYFFGGTLFERLGGGSIFWLPPALHVVQLLILWTYSRKNPRRPGLESAISPVQVGLSPGPLASAPSRKSFQRMAWLANPFASVAAFTLLALIPTIAGDLGMSPSSAGLFCSIWFFARLAAFIVLWKWSDWHYRFRWLLGGYVALLIGFVMILTATDLLWLSLGQISFGAAVGLLGYSSLYYSMDVGSARAANGGIHEAVMGVGNFIGPGIGAGALLLAPQSPHASTWAVGGLLTMGLLGLVGMRIRLDRRGATTNCPP